MRIGFGYDIHPLVEGRPLILGGVEIPFSRGLDGHSDADVLLHAVADALLGAAGLGDIGTHFPNTDEEYRGISSLVLLERTADLIRKNGWTVENVDATVIAEAPKLSPHRDHIRENISRALGLSPDRVSVKATTHEGIDGTGRGEAIAAYAVTLLDAGKR